MDFGGFGRALSWDGVQRGAGRPRPARSPLFRSTIRRIGSRTRNPAVARKLSPVCPILLDHHFIQIDISNILST